MTSVFISYRQIDDAQRERVHSFAEKLRDCDINVILDQFYLCNKPGGPPEGWPKWSSDRAIQTERVIIIGNEPWFNCFDGNERPGKGLGAAAEAHDIRDRIYQKAGINEDIRVVLLDDADSAHISSSLRRYHHFHANRDFDSIVQWLDGIPLTPQTVQRSIAKLAQWAGGGNIVTLAVVFTDIINSAKLSNEIGDADWNVIRQKHFVRGKRLAEKLDGFLIKTMGDSLMVVFRNAPSALDFLLDFRQDTGDSIVNIRQVAHIGAVILDGEDVFGHHVDLSARLAGKAEGGDIVVTDVFKKDVDSIRNAKHNGLAWEAIIGVSFKGFSELVDLWRLRIGVPPSSSSISDSSLDTDQSNSSTAVLSNLPRRHGFFGRKEELKKIAEALSPKTRTWGALIDGPGGIGKTTLAIRAAELVPAGQFKHIFFLSSKDKKLTADGARPLKDFVNPGYLYMLNEIALKLKENDFAKTPETERARLLIDALAPAQALLILDNLESLAKDEQNRLFDFLSQLPPGCKAIATSRRRSDVDCRIIRLEKLEQDEALALIAELATDRPLLAKASQEDRIHLYLETGGNPLVLRWVAGQLGRGHCRTITVALDFLRSASGSNDPLEFIFGDLLEEFNENETKLLAALTYFTRPVKVIGIAELASMSIIAAETTLNGLSNRALVVPNEEETLFVLAPMVADFLRRERPEVIAETRRRLERRAYALIVENGDDNYARFPQLNADWHIVSPALTVFVAEESKHRLQRVCDALWRFFEYTGRWDEWLALEEQAEAKALANRDYRYAGWRAEKAGRVHFLREEADAVLACANRAAAHWQKAGGAAREQSVAIRLLGMGHTLKKEYPAAIAAYRESLALRRAISVESTDVAVALNDLASVEKLSGDFEASEKDYREAIRVARAINYAEGIANFTSNLAGLALERKDWHGAEILEREALPLSEKLGRQELIAASSGLLAMALARQGKKADALPYAQRAVEILTKLGSPDIAEAREILKECGG